MSIYRIHEIKLNIGEDEKCLPLKILAKLRLEQDGSVRCTCNIIRKSVDARDKGKIQFIYSLDFELIGNVEGADESSPASAVAALKKALDRGIITDVSGESAYEIPETAACERKRPVIVGFGPCGIFAGYVLAKAGLMPIILERGKPIDERVQDVLAFRKSRQLDPESNLLFGEGGAGTFSDGKLTTGIGDPRKNFVLKTLSDAGGGEDILYLAKPHIGTDILRIIVKNLRDEIIAAGGEVRFGCRLTGIKTEYGKLTGVETVRTSSFEAKRAGAAGTAETERQSDRLGSGELTDEESKQAAASATDCDDPAGIMMETVEIATDRLILAIGHSARDTAEMLLLNGIPMEQKAFSMGVRIEHPQELIDRAQYGDRFEEIYGKSPHEAGLPPAEYKLSGKAKDGRGVYTFCMCPGGDVVSAASEMDGLFTNGMSNRARDGAFANSAVLVDIRPDDFGSRHPLAGTVLQRKYEQAAFELSNSGLAPSETLESFAGSDSILAKCLPDFVASDILEVIPVFGRKLKGFDAPDSVLYGPETRSSSPIRMIRDKEGMSAIDGIYPCGEGAGYAGGIMSAAIDGIKAAEKIIEAEKVIECDSISQ